MPSASPTRRRRSSERGAIAVETAIVSVMLLMLMAGIIDSSMLFRDSIIVSSAARAGARTGSAEPLASSFATDAAGQALAAMTDLVPGKITKIWVFKASTTTGAPASGSSCSSSCVKFTVSSSGVLSSPSGSWSARNACAGSPTINAVGVLVEYRHPSTMGFFFNNQLLTETTAMQLEPVPSNLACVSS